jgi:hypothetical protein
MGLDEEELRDKVNAFLETIDDERDNTWSATAYSQYSYVLREFLDWLAKPAKEKQLRYAQYLELKKEFAPEGSDW